MRRQPALDVGVRAVAASIVAAAPQRDERERDEQRDHDPGGLVDEHAHAVAGDEAHAAQPEAGGARLRSSTSTRAGVVQPQISAMVDRRAGAAWSRASIHVARDVHARGAAQREGDVVGRDARSPATRSVAEAARPSTSVADAEVPRAAPRRARSRPRRAAPRQVAPGDDRVAAPAAGRRPARRRARGPWPPARQADAVDLEAVRARREVRQRAHDARRSSARRSASKRTMTSGRSACARRAVEAGGQPVGDGHRRRRRQRRGERRRAAAKASRRAPHAASRRPSTQAQHAVGGAVAASLVGDEHDRAPVVGRAAQQRQHGGAGLGVEVAGRLVGEHDAPGR